VGAEKRWGGMIGERVSFNHPKIERKRYQYLKMSIFVAKIEGSQIWFFIFYS